MDATKFSRVIKPQEGFQTAFLSTSADIAIGGGAAGAGKTFAEILEPLRHKNNPQFAAVIFRRNIPQITMQGGLRDESLKVYPSFGAKLANQSLKWYFPSGATFKMTHLEDDKTVYNHQGGQYALIMFDELTHFSKFQFFYMLTRNRSTCGVKPYVRATCNPDPDSWVANFLEWWIDQDPKSPHYGFPIPERAGKLRYMVAYNDDIIWGDSKAEVYSLVPKEYWQMLPKSINPSDMIKSVTFIPGSVYENKELLKTNPQYLGNLMAQDEQTKSQLLLGNWKIRTDGTSLFRHQAILDTFSNYALASKLRCITCDAARFGNDLTVIFVWKGWHVVKIIILTKSDANEIHAAIEAERKRFTIPISKVVVDQDGVGGGVVKLGRYIGFSGGAKPMKDPQTLIKEEYENLKTQCFYRIAEKVNDATIAISISNETVMVDGVYGAKMKMKGKLVEVKDLIIQDLRVIKALPVDEHKKRRINKKEEQKILLGRSPDFADTLMIREFIELKGSLAIGGESSEDNTALDELNFD
jgi:hypothetical protein